MRVLFKWLLRLFLIAIIGLPLLLAAALYLAVEDRPLISRAAEIKPENIERARRIVERNDPRKMRPGVLRTIAITGPDLDLAVNYLANRYARGSAAVVLQQGAANVRLSVQLPDNPLGRFVNIDAALVETASLPRFDELRIGRLPVPGWLANGLLRVGIRQLQQSADYGAAADVIRHVSARGNLLLVVYEWNDAVPDQIRAVLVPPAEQARLQACQQRLVEAIANTPGGDVRFEDLLGPLLELAASRSANGDAAAENRAAIISLAFYVNGKGLGAIIPAARDWPRPTQRHVVLGGRHDFAQHFSISAAIAATSGSPLADAVGLYKEVDDSRGGTGFSFNDIAADRTGTRFGELATASPAGAQKVQRLATGGLSETIIFPEVKDLPEFMQEAEFKSRYGGIGGAEYRKMMAEIERRVAALAVFR